jgi:hypothetical protein
MLLNDMHTDWDDADNDTREAIATLHTSGTGYWSRTATTVRITQLTLHAFDAEFGELCVHFNTDDWRADNLGLIYTDKLFMQELQVWLTSEGYAGDDVSYSEQGMQGDNYVSCDVGKKFVASWMQKHKEFVIADF